MLSFRHLLVIVVMGTCGLSVEGQPSKNSKRAPSPEQLLVTYPERYVGKELAVDVLLSNDTKAWRSGSILVIANRSSPLARFRFTTQSSLAEQIAKLPQPHWARLYGEVVAPERDSNVYSFEVAYLQLLDDKRQPTQTMRPDPKAAKAPTPPPPTPTATPTATPTVQPVPNITQNPSGTATNGTTLTPPVAAPAQEQQANQVPLAVVKTEPVPTTATSPPSQNNDFLLWIGGGVAVLIVGGLMVMRGGRRPTSRAQFPPKDDMQPKSRAEEILHDVARKHIAEKGSGDKSDSTRGKGSEHVPSKAGDRLARR